VSTLSRTAPTGRPNRRFLWKETGRGKNRFEIRDLFADEWCSQEIIGFLVTTDVGRRITDTAEEGSQSEMRRGTSGTGGEGAGGADGSRAWG